MRELCCLLIFLCSATHASSEHRILVVNPNTSEGMTAGIAENARRYARDV